MLGISGYIAVAAGVVVAIAVGATVVQTKRLEAEKVNSAQYRTLAAQRGEALADKEKEILAMAQRKMREDAARAERNTAAAEDRKRFAEIEKEVANASNPEACVGPGVRASLRGLRNGNGAVAGEDGVPSDRAAPGLPGVPGGAPGTR